MMDSCTDHPLNASRAPVRPAEPDARPGIRATVAPSWPAAVLACAGLFLVPVPAAHSQTQLPQTQSPQTQWRSARPVASRAAVRARSIDPRALQAVRNMAAYMRTLSNFQIRATTVRDEIGARGQKVSYRGTIDYKVRRPNGFMVRSNEAGRQRQLIYDGRTLTVFTPNSGYFAKVQAPPTIRQTLALAADRYDIHPPLYDLFKWNAGDTSERKLTSARYVGMSIMNGLPVDTYAFRQPGKAWRISIVRGPNPLPVRIAVTSTNTPRPLSFRANLAWTTSTRFAANTFYFQPPPGSRQIGIASG